MRLTISGISNTVPFRFAALFLCGAISQGWSHEHPNDEWSRVLPEKPDRTILRDHHDPSLIFVKFLDSSSVRTVDGRFVTDDVIEDSEVQAGTAFLIMAQAMAEPMVDEDPKVLHERRDEAIRNLGREIADLTKWFIVRVPDGADTAKWIDRLNRLELVEIAIPGPKPPPPPQSWSHCESSSCVADQGYLSSPASTPRGVNAQAVWSQYGATGQGVRLANIEYAYVPHVDLPTITNLLGNDPSHQWADHGTKVFGILSSISNSFGTTGLAYGADPHFAAQNWGNPCQALNASVNALEPGDVIVIEQQIEGPNDPFVPVEWHQPYYDCIVTAVGNGYIVVMAAGNGGEDLDSPAFDSGHRPFIPQNDSGSIIVGAGHRNTLNQLDSSTYGSRVNVQGWGHNVLTTFPTDTYGMFSGTSSATAIVGGTVALVQSTYRDETGQIATPAQMRSALIATGTPQGTGGHIGPLPNALAAAQQLISSAPPGVPGDFTVTSWFCWGQGEAWWNGVSGATSYQLQASTSSHFPPLDSWIEFSGSGTWVTLNVTQSTYFRVRACNGGNCGQYTGSKLLVYRSGCM
jgi:hypothetical protein